MKEQNVTNSEINTANKDITKTEDIVNQKLNEMIGHYTSIAGSKSLNLVKRKVKSKDDFFTEVKELLAKNDKSLTTEMITKIVNKFEQYLWGYYILEDLINDESISDIKVLAFDNIRVKRYGKRESADIKFRSIEDYQTFVNMVAINNERSLSDIDAIQVFTDKNTNPNFILRFNITTKFINSVNWPYLHIRKHAKKKKLMSKLIEEKMLDREMADYLIKMAKNKEGILFTGKGAAGKTTLMNALLDEIPHDQSALVIQENEELFSNTHPDMMFQHVVIPNGEGKIKYVLKDEAVNGLLTDLDVFVIGEIKGKEALDLLIAAYTGHVCWASVHGASSKKAHNKLADYAMSERIYQKDEILKMLTEIPNIIFLEDYKVKEISRISGWDEERNVLMFETIFSDTENNIKRGE